VPFRLLGLVVDPSQASRLSGHTLSHYASSGNEVTLLCAAGRGWSASDAIANGRSLGISKLIALDFESAELGDTSLEAILSDVITTLRPHVVLAQPSAELERAVAAAFRRARQQTGGSAAIPAKLYYRAEELTPDVTTLINPPQGKGPEFFVRAHPSPWVTGVLERDLLAGIGAASLARLEERLAA
jgi:LmbE family N-acetylglucosaminyl deacetylase